MKLQCDNDAVFWVFIGFDLWKLFSCADTMLVAVQRPSNECGSSLADICQTDGQ